MLVQSLKVEPHFPKNYRPISLLSCVSKVFERYIFKVLTISVITIYYHLIKVFTRQKTVYLNSKSVYIMKHIYHSTKAWVLIYQKLLTELWHLGLLFKLKSIELGGKSLNWLGIYLRNRHQRVVLND